MPDSETTQPARGRLPSGALAVTLRSQVADVMRVLDECRVSAAADPFRPRPRLLDQYAPELEAAMLALGDTLARFLYESDKPVDLEALRSDYLEPILSLSHSLPVFKRAEDWQRNKAKTVELHELVLEGRAVGFDAETLLLDNFYQNTIFAQALRTRVPALAQLIREEADMRLETGQEELQILVLGANSVVNVASLFRNDVADVKFSVLIVDGDTQALRLARLHAQDTLGVRPAVMRMKPEAFAAGRSRIRTLFDLIFTLMLYDMYTPQTAKGFTAGLGELLKPGGVLLTGCFLPDVPISYRAIGVAFVGVEWQYWDETMWREMLAASQFDLAESRFEVIAPATLTVLARRHSAQQPAG